MTARKGTDESGAFIREPERKGIFHLLSLFA